MEGVIVAHFAQINDNIVSEVIVISNADIDNMSFPESEPIGQAFITSLGIDGTWIQTSYNGSFRNIYAGNGYTFDPSVGEYGAFIKPVA